MKKLTPTTLLFVLACTWNFALKAQNTFPTGVGTNVGIGTTSPASPLDIRVTGTAIGGIPMALSASATTGASGSWNAIGFTATQTGANPSALETLGATAVTGHPAGSNITILMPGSFIAEHAGTGTVTETRGVMSDLLFTSTSGNVTNAECFIASSGIIGGTSTGTITNGYGFYLAPFTSNFVHKYGFYINDATANNYLAGSMSIGTTSVPAGYNLAVDGAAICTQMVVKTFPWSDYVFQKDYHLPSLDSVALYVKEHQHLSGVPSAAEVEKNGVDVGATEAVLLKKIEELTLYLIKQNDVQQAQTQEIEGLKKKVAELSSNR
jgi:hypothetical protein